MQQQPTLVYLYGPPAAGKLTIATEVAALTGFRLFHNHLTVNAIRAVFDFGSAPFVELLHRVRLETFGTAMRAGVSLVFTNNSMWGGGDGEQRFQAFATEAAATVEAAGGRTVFVRVSAPLAVLEARISDESRRTNGKLVEVARLRELMGEHDEPQVHPDDLVVDTQLVAPEDAARLIAARLM